MAIPMLTQKVAPERNPCRGSSPISPPFPWNGIFQEPLLRPRCPRTSLPDCLLLGGSVGPKDLAGILVRVLPGPHMMESRGWPCLEPATVPGRCRARHGSSWATSAKQASLSCIPTLPPPAPYLLQGRWRPLAPLSSKEDPGGGGGTRGGLLHRHMSSAGRTP